MKTKVETKASRIRKLTAAGHRPREIAAMTGFRVQTVYDVLYKDKVKAQLKAAARAKAGTYNVMYNTQAEAAPKKRGRPKGSGNKTPVSTHVHIASLKKLRQSPEGIDSPRLPPGKTLAPDAQQHVIYMGNPNPTLWSRIKAVFTGRYE